MPKPPSLNPKDSTPRSGRFFGWTSLMIVALGLATNWPVIAREWPAAHGPLGYARIIALPCVLAFTWGLFATSSRLLAVTVLPFVVFWGLLFSYYTYFLGIVVTPHLFSGIFGTDWGEVGQFARPRVMAYVLVPTAMAVGGSLWLHRHAPPRRVRYAVALVGLAAYVVIAGFAKPHYARNNLYFPFVAQRNLADYLKIRRGVVEQLEHKTNLGTTYPPTLARPVADDLMVVFVQGEAARADHFSLNGYPRETNPELSKIPNLVSIKDVWSCAAITQKSVPCMLTRATDADMAVSNRETSFISVFREAGFDTTFLSGDRRAFEYTIPINSIAEEAKTALFHEEAASALARLGVTPPCDVNCDAYHWPAALEVIASDQGRRGLLVMTTHGSHLDYVTRYPRSFARFTPECTEGADSVRKCSIDSVVNAYDNTLLFTDHLLAELIAKLADRTALLFYSADHGQHLGENGVYFHGYLAPDHGTPQLRQVPWLVWGSDRFVRGNPEAWANLQRNASFKASHHDLFHSVLDCAGIASAAVDRAHSVCSADFKPRDAAAAPSARPTP